MRLKTERFLLPCFPEVRFFQLPECSPEAESSLALYSDFRHIVISGRQEFLKAQYNRFSDREHSRMGPSLLLHKNPAGMMPPGAFELISRFLQDSLFFSLHRPNHRFYTARRSDYNIPSRRPQYPEHHPGSEPYLHSVLP